MLLIGGTAGNSTLQVMIVTGRNGKKAGFSILERKEES